MKTLFARARGLCVIGLVCAVGLACGSKGSKDEKTEGGEVESAKPTTAETTPAAKPVVLSTFEEGLTANHFGQDWRAVDDKGAGGASNASLEVVDGGAASTGKALRVTGTAKVGDFPFPFAGIALPLGKIDGGRPAPVDLSGYKGIRFWAKGNGKKYLIRLQADAVKDFNYHHYVFEAGPEWKQHEVRLADLVQFDWGQELPWDGKNIRSMFVVNYSAPGEDFGELSFTIDEIGLF